MRISQIVSSITTSHVQNTASISTISTELAQLDDHETDLRETITRTEEKRSWFTDFREWLENVATFLDEKVRSREIYVFPSLFLILRPPRSFLKWNNWRRSMSQY
jgi:hypothetical protein